MGCSMSAEDRAALNRSKLIDLELRKGAMDVRLLLFGVPGAGKSTIAKQLKIIHGGDYTAEERDSYKVVVYRNITRSIMAIVEAMGDLKIDFGDAARAHDAHQLVALASSVEEGGMLSAELTALIQRLWKDAGVQACFDRSREYQEHYNQFTDSVAHYLNDLERICQPNYVPSQQDVLRAYAKTDGILETQWTHHVANISLTEVSLYSHLYRRIFSLVNIHCVVFCVALSDYDVVLFGAESVQMHEAMQFFEALCNQVYRGTPVILLLNKKDLFAKKISRSPLTVCYPEYLGGNSYEETVSYIQSQFVYLVKNTKMIYTHLICAIDTEQMQSELNMLSDNIIACNISRMGPC